MSSSSSALSHQLRQRAARLGDAGVRRRLSVVPARQTAAPRLPFVALVGIILAGGVAGLLMFNTHMQQGAFEVTRLQAQASALAAVQQDEAMQLQKISNPQQLAVAASKLGMVAPANPAFLNLATGQVLGVPTAATPKGSIDVGGAAIAPTPASLAPPPVIVTVQAPPTPGAATPPAGQSSTSTAKTNPGTGAAGH